LVVLEPLDFMARLAALVPRPRLNLTRFHAVFAIDIETCPERRLHSGTRDGAPQVLFSAELKVAPASRPALLGRRPLFPRSRGNVHAIREANRQNGLEITPGTAVPRWYGEKMDGSLAVLALIQRE
jgi:hypothetical protein